jgi:preprotein translocase subunit SecY
MFANLKKIWNLKDLRGRILLSISLLVGYRILAHIPLPGLNAVEVKQFFENNDLFNLINLFSGGGLTNFSIILVGISPYITSSIIFQLLTLVVPALEELQKEGEYGRQKITQYTRLATIPLGIVQTFGTLLLLKSQGIIAGWTSFDLMTMLLVATGGTLLLMWIGELISENGLGNGISLIIAVGILASLPAQIKNTLDLMGVSWLAGRINLDNFRPDQAWITAGFLLFAIVATAAIVLVTEGERQISVTYARRMRGRSSTGGVNTHLPIRVTTAGVIPIIFAISLMLFPPLIAKFLTSATNPTVQTVGNAITSWFQNNTFYSLLYFLLVVGFTYFYTSIVFQPTQVAENLQRQGGFIPGVRPGSETTRYLSFIVSRITLAGALFLGLIAVLPFIVQLATHTQTLVLGGTGLLIIVSVIIETMRQFRAQLVMRTYN